MTSIRRPWPPALQWAAQSRKPVVIHLRTLAGRERVRVFRMRRHVGAVTWEFVEELPRPGREVKKADRHK